MYEENVLGLEDAHKAMNAMLTEARKQPERPVAVAVVDGHGRLVAFARMDKCKPTPVVMAFKKAYSAAMLGDTGTMSERLGRMRIGVVDFGDSNLTTAQGGIALHGSSGGPTIGAIGVSGLRSEEDENLARLGARAMGF